MNALLRRRPVAEQESHAGLEWILDSGAFSAWKRKQPIDLNDYCRFIEEHRHQFRYAVALDTIPGEFGRQPTAQEVDYAAHKSFETYLQMRARLPWMRNDQLIPVYHQGEDLSHFENLVNAGAMYIGVSPQNGIPQVQRHQWTRYVVEELGDKLDYIKLHAFGVGSARSDDSSPVIPVTSLDASSYALASGQSRIMMPHARGFVTQTSVVSAPKHEREAVAQRLLDEARVSVPTIPACLTARHLLHSESARMVFNFKVAQQYALPCTLYAPVLLYSTVMVMRCFCPKHLLVSYAFLKDKTTSPSSLYPMITAPQSQFTESYGLARFDAECARNAYEPKLPKKRNTLLCN